MPPHAFDDRRSFARRLRETADGRSEGWDLELEGRVVARLDEPCREDMFWVSYRITPETDDPALAAELLSEAFWRGEGWSRVTYRSRALGVAATYVFPATRPFVAPARLNLRGLYRTREDDPSPGWLARLSRRLLRR